MFWVLLALVILAAMAITVIALVPNEPFCNYCNNDGDPCPRCHGLTTNKEI